VGQWDDSPKKRGYLLGRQEDEVRIAVVANDRLVEKDRWRVEMW
jgi:hypothetical protein